MASTDKQVNGKTKEEKKKEKKGKEEKEKKNDVDTFGLAMTGTDLALTAYDLAGVVTGKYFTDTDQH